MARRRRGGPEEPADADLGPEADPESVARTIVLTKLTARARSRHELADALAARDVPEEVAGRVLDRFEEVGLVDDRAFADAWVESRRQAKGLSGRALVQELRRKGVDDEIARSCVEHLDADDDRRVARELAVRKLRSLGRCDDATKVRRLTSLLARKGFPSGLCMSVARELVGEAVDDESA